MGVPVVSIEEDVMPLSEREVQAWQTGNVRATTDSAGYVSIPQILAGVLALVVTIVIGTMGWVLLLSLLAP